MAVDPNVPIVLRTNDKDYVIQVSKKTGGLNLTGAGGGGGVRGKLTITEHVSIKRRTQPGY